MIKAIFLLIIFPIFLFLIQSSLIIHYSFGGGSANIVLVYFILLTYFSKDSKNILFAALTSGLLSDFLSAHFFGLYIIIFAVLAAISKGFSSSLEKKNILSFILYSGLLIIVHQLLIAVFLLIKEKIFFWNVWGLIQSFLAAIIIYLAYDFFKKRIKSEKRKNRSFGR